jgi:hypothetical protein
MYLHQYKHLYHHLLRTTGKGISGIKINFLTPWNRTFLELLTAIHLFEKSLCYRTQRSITLACNLRIVQALTIDFVLSGRAAMGGGGGSSSTSLLVAADVTLPPPSVSGVVDEGLLLDGWLKLC